MKRIAIVSALLAIIALTAHGCCCGLPTSSRTSTSSSTSTPTVPPTPPPVVPPSMPPGTPPGTPPTPPPGGDAIAANMAARAAQFAAGMVPATPLARGTLATSATQDFTFTFTAGKCYKIIGVGGPTVTDLDLKLYDTAGAMLQQDIATDNYPVLGLSQPFCAATAGSYRIEVRMYAGSGEFGLQAFTTP
ncbi:MAG: hypothetical protein IT379_12960 [Deltaproteobacteria bacterium]|nr:hypothetical protein [Deltaproteobacteria bacterium]